MLRVQTPESPPTFNHPVNIRALTSVPKPTPECALAFNAGHCLAAGNDSGEVTVWRVSAEPSPDAGMATGRAPLPRSLNLPPQAPAPQERRPTTDAAPLAKISAGRLPILSLAFCRDYVRDPLHPAPETQWLLAIGDSGGGVSIWEVPKQRLKRTYAGAAYDVRVLALSPDGTLLATGGRERIVCWDTATGNPTLTLGGEDVSGIGFSGDGSSFTATQNRDNRLSCSGVWKVENGRSIRTMRGLADRVTRTCFSTDGRWLAAVSHSWQVGVWDLSSKQLLHVFNMPRGLFTADNAGLAFNHDGSQFAFMAGTNAILLQVASGTRIQNWQLPPGFVEELAFNASGHLLAFHLEPTNAAATTFSGPTTARIRDLSAVIPMESVIELPQFNWNVRSAAWTGDGVFLLVDGIGIQGGWTNRWVVSVASSPWRVIWSHPLPWSPTWQSPIRVDAAGKQFAFQPATNENTVSLCDLTSTNCRQRLALAPTAFNSASGLISLGAGSQPFSLYSLRDEAPLLTIWFSENTPSFFPTFSRDGRSVAWGNQDGTVSVGGLEEMRERLNQLRLGW